MFGNGLKDIQNKPLEIYYIVIIRAWIYVYETKICGKTQNMYFTNIIC